MFFISYYQPKSNAPYYSKIFYFESKQNKDQTHCIMSNWPYVGLVRGSLAEYFYIVDNCREKKLRFCMFCVNIDWPIIQFLKGSM
jgi:hypothetical protein